MKFAIFDNISDAQFKIDTIDNLSLFTNSNTYAIITSCKHPNLDKWAIPVISEVEKYFENTVDTLDNTWIYYINK